MHLSYPIPIVVARPFTSTVANGSVRRMTSRIAVPLIGVQYRAPDRNVLIDQFVAGALIRMITDPKAMFPALTRDQMNDRWTIISIRAATALLIGSSPGGGSP